MRWVCAGLLVVLGVAQVVFGAAVGLTWGGILATDPSLLLPGAAGRGAVLGAGMVGFSVVLAVLDLLAAWAVASRRKLSVVLVALLVLIYLPGCAPLSLLVAGTLAASWGELFAQPPTGEAEPDADGEDREDDEGGSDAEVDVLVDGGPAGV